MNHFLVERIDELRARLWANPEHSDREETIPWNWVMSETLSFLEKYSSGVSEAVLISHLQCKWGKRLAKSKNTTTYTKAEYISLSELLSGRLVHVPHAAMLRVKVIACSMIPPTQIKVVTLCDLDSEAQLDWYLPTLYQGLPDTFFQSRTLRLSQCKVVQSFKGGLRLLPTECVLWELYPPRDHQFIRQRSYAPLNMVGRSDARVSSWIFVRIASKSSPSTIGKNRKQKIKVMDQWNKVLPLYLFDNQISLAQMMNKGDLFLLSSYHHKTEGAETALYWGEDTVGYLIQTDGMTPAEQRDFFTEVKFSIPQPEPMEFARKMCLAEISQSSKRVCFLAICTDIGSNSPVAFDGRTLDRCLICCQDETQQRYNVTIWDQVFQVARTVRPGHLLFFENTTTTPDKKFFTNCWQSKSSWLYNITLIDGIFHSPFFQKTMFLSEGVKHSSFLSRACVVDWALPHHSLPPVSNSYHSCCERELTSKEEEGAEPMLFCPFCLSAVPSAQVISVFTLRWVIDDGSGNKMEVTASPKAHQILIQMTPFDFQSYTPEERNHILARVLEHEYIFWINQVPGESNSYRIDQVSRCDHSAPTIQNNVDEAALESSLELV